MMTDLTPQQQMAAICVLDQSFQSNTSQHTRVMLVGTAWAFYPTIVGQLISEHGKLCWPMPLIRACARARSVML